MLASLSFQLNNIPIIIKEHLDVLGPIDHFTLAVNLIILVFSKWFASKYGLIKDNSKSQARLRILHVTNLILFTTYLIAVIFEIHLGRAISQTFLVVLASYLLIHFAEAFILKKYGKSKTIENFARTTETHTSRTLELFVCFIIITISIVLLINIWGLEDWLQTTSVLGFLALFIFASKEYWAGDFLSGILIISQGRIERGDVIKIKDEELSAIVLQVGSFQTIVRDLVNKHDIILPNSKLRLARVDILKSDLKGIREFEDFWFGYGIELKKVEEMLEEAWEKTMEEGLVDKYGGCIIANKECGDHGVRWRLAYTLKSPHKIIETGNRIREWAYQLQDKHGLQLATPLTHDLSNTTIQVQKLENG
ncbi:MAG: mechanosensitive ion channel family protein [Opitutales bacterium]|nr:mechanosensitive ion channel family protein [Opitutales bacterium]